MGGHPHEYPASFDKFRMRVKFWWQKKNPHPEPIDGRTSLISAAAEIPFTSVVIKRCFT
jgi:hypothetical protein